MPNNNLPPGWQNRNSSAKPDWGNQKKEISKNDNKNEDNIKSDEPIKLDERNQEIFQHENSDTADNKTESIPVQSAYEPQNDAEKMPKKSNTTVIVLSILLIVAVIILCIIIFLYFRNENTANNTSSVSTAVSEISSQITAKTTAVTTTKATTVTTTTTTTTTSAVTTVTATTATLLNADNYTGFWHIENYAESELTIHSIDSSKVSFSIWYYRLWSSEILTATLDENIAYFYDDEIEGVLTFNDDSITLLITMSNISGVPSQVEEVYSMRIDDSVQYGDSLQYFNVPSVEINELNEIMLGEINCQGYIVSGYDSSYICNNGEPAVVRDSLGDTWHISAVRSCSNYGIVWYECYDTDDGDYYGWVDSDFITFYTFTDGMADDGRGEN